MEKYQAKYLQEKNTNTDSSLVVDKYKEIESIKEKLKTIVSKT
jgi:hypothetical protein